MDHNWPQGVQPQDSSDNTESSASTCADADRSGCPDPQRRGTDAALPHDQVVSATSDDCCVERETQVSDDVHELREYTAAFFARIGIQKTGNASPADPPQHQDNGRAAHVTGRPGNKAASPTADANTCRPPTTRDSSQPRLPPPETDSWNALREVANNYADSAINTREQRVLVRRALNSGATSLACLIGAIVALICAPILGRAMLAAAIGVIVGGVYSLYVCFNTSKNYFEFCASSRDKVPE